jgi:hypothetical protein
VAGYLRAPRPRRTQKSLSIAGEALVMARDAAIGEFSSSDFADVHGVDAFAAFLGFKFYPVVLLHCGPVQARYVYEKIFFRLVVGHEAIAFGFVKKFDDAGFHAKNKKEKKKPPG